ncbi:Lysosomal Pro-X carboxypeptidase [Vitis vinifera]|uniref:Lysosomal Pro-X carboxypeptidase n=1 Tax=Vitis vinifera TaxID=29760 RepID=A0A438KFF7_VITVI|nr:Lysosomal Pro-X carboxypeptidase [Vitis vinifera]
MAQQLSLLLSLLLVTAICVSAMYPITARFGAVNKLVKSDFEVELPPEFVTYFYNQTLDHFNYKPESYRTFQQRYIMNSAYWGGANSSSPIFVYTGDEASITAVADFAGFIVELASRFNGLLLYIEFNHHLVLVLVSTFKVSYCQNMSIDIMVIQFHSDPKMKHSVTQVPSENCPVIAIGGSYGGMLASWFRLKYPHIVIGALASSAPILYFDDITPGNAYHVIVTKDFRETSESCYSTIRDSWSEIDKVAAEPNGLANLSQIFMTCEPLNSSQELKYYLALCYVVSAQNDNPPAYPVKKVCDAIDGAPEGTDIIGRVAAGLNASVGPPCHFTCTEMVMPIGHGANDTMFQAWPFDLNNHTKTCQDLFGVTPRPHWITTEFGGHDIKSVVGNFASNIIFSNGLRDPYSAGGVLQDISDSVVAIYTDKGAHCLDLSTPTATDPDWLVSQQEKEVKIIGLWLAEYNARLISKAHGRMG